MVTLANCACRRTCPSLASLPTSVASERIISTRRRPGLSAVASGRPVSISHTNGHGIEKLRARGAFCKVCDGILDQVRVGSEILQLVDPVVESDHGGFAGWPHDGVRKQNAGLAYLRQEGFDARARLDQNHHGYRIAAEIEVGYLLNNAVIRYLKIPGFQVVNHVAMGIAHRHGRVYERNSHFDLGLRIFGRQLDFDAGFGREWPGGRLSPSGNAWECQEKQQAYQCASDPRHFAHLAAQTEVCATTGVYLIRRISSGRRCRER